MLDNFSLCPLKWIDTQIKNAEKHKCIAIVVCIDANIRSHRYLDRETRYDARTVGKEQIQIHRTKRQLYFMTGN